MGQDHSYSSLRIALPHWRRAAGNTFSNWRTTKQTTYLVFCPSIRANFSCCATTKLSKWASQTAALAFWKRSSLTQLTRFRWHWNPDQSFSRRNFLSACWCVSKTFIFPRPLRTSLATSKNLLLPALLLSVTSMKASSPSCLNKRSFNWTVDQ